PYTREEKTSNATKGAAIGAGVGIVAGLISGDNARERRERALIGAGVGALAGGGIGYYMDVQETKLRKQLEGTGVSVTRYGDEIVLNMPGNITFATDSTELRADFLDVLDSVSIVLRKYEKTMIEITGHTDSTGAASYNQQLSERRADAVARYLRSTGIMSARIATEGLGEHYPKASNATPGGRSQNRRVELRLVPITR
ncbi:MAG: OmpA family protein, partial [Gammaproteobacteria bacterium]|nr:OmpA family protein [Gammaproteobacteria bacterium]